jgi:hypothetical protein
MLKSIKIQDSTLQELKARRKVDDSIDDVIVRLLVNNPILTETQPTAS